MSNATIYTAVGRLEMHREDGRPAFPAIMLRGKEYFIDRQELLLWSCLNWRLLKKDQIGLHYEKLAIAAEYISTRSWEQCLSRLLQRGLVIEGKGDTEYDALYDLLAPLSIVPIGGSAFTRLASFAKLILWDSVPFSAASRLLKADHRTTCEKQVMRLAVQTLLSVAEVVRCIERGVHNVATSDAVVAQIYDDKDTTSLNLPTIAKTDSNCCSVITAVANLYLRQQIIFDCV